MKRKFEQLPSSIDEAIANSDSYRQKKRFIWPESLHKAFIGAVFEIGLTSCSPDEMCLNLMNKLPPSDELKKESVLSYIKSLSKYSQLQYKHFSNEQSDDETCLADYDSTEMSNAWENLNSQAKSIINVINFQSQLAQNIKLSLAKQYKALQLLQSKISLLEPFAKANTASTLPYNDSNLVSKIDRVDSENVGISASKIAKHTPFCLENISPYDDNAIISEMITHMDLHRMLLGRRNNQLSLFATESNPIANSQFVPSQYPQNIVEPEPHSVPQSYDPSLYSFSNSSDFPSYLPSSPMESNCSPADVSSSMPPKETLEDRNSMPNLCHSTPTYSDTSISSLNGTSNAVCGDSTIDNFGDWDQNQLDDLFGFLFS